MISIKLVGVDVVTRKQPLNSSRVAGLDCVAQRCRFSRWTEIWIHVLPFHKEPYGRHPVALQCCV